MFPFLKATKGKNIQGVNIFYLHCIPSIPTFLSALYWTGPSSGNWVCTEMTARECTQTQLDLHSVVHQLHRNEFLSSFRNYSKQQETITVGTWAELNNKPSKTWSALTVKNLDPARMISVSPEKQRIRFLRFHLSIISGIWSKPR